MDFANGAGTNVSFTEDNQTLNFVIKDMMNNDQMQGIGAEEDQQWGTTTEKIFTP